MPLPVVPLPVVPLPIPVVPPVALSVPEPLAPTPVPVPSVVEPLDMSLPVDVSGLDAPCGVFASRSCEHAKGRRSVRGNIDPRDHCARVSQSELRLATTLSHLRARRRTSALSNVHVLAQEMHNVSAPSRELRKTVAACAS